MDQQNPNENAVKHVFTEEEIARLEAEAVAAIQRGEPVPRREAAAEDAPQAESAEAATVEKPRYTPGRDDFVPYVDDVPQAESAPSKGEEEDEPYIPSAWEKRIDALTPEQWKRWQILGGGVLGALVVASLFCFGEELSTYGLLVGALLAVFLPRYLERAWRRKLTVARTAMIVVMVVGLIVMGIVIGARTGLLKKVS